MFRCLNVVNMTKGYQAEPEESSRRFPERRGDGHRKRQ